MKSLVFAVMWIWSTLLHAADLTESLILVAKPGRTGVPLGKVLPGHGASKKVIDPGYATLRPLLRMIYSRCALKQS